jgi:hypothetical protein
MNLKFDIPEALKPNFQRVYRRIPMELRQNPELIKDLVLFLKVGGERLARQHLEVTKNDLKLVKTALRKERRREAMRRTAAAAAENAAADNAAPNNGAPDNGGDETVHAENKTDASGTVDTDQEKDAVAVEDDESVDDMDSDVDDLDAEEEEDTDFDD